MTMSKWKYATISSALGMASKSKSTVCRAHRNSAGVVSGAENRHPVFTLLGKGRKPPR